MVQGVFFRSATEELARRLELSGWIRNQPDGTVAAEFQGRPEAVDEVIDFCRRGPSHAEVHDVEVRELETVADADGFLVR
jgi:acylphosphatase